MRQKEGSERCNQYSSTVGIALCTAPPPLPIRARGRAERDYFFLADFEKGDFPSFLFLEKDGHTRDGSGEIACWVVIRRVRASKECISGVTRSLPPDFVPKNARAAKFTQTGPPFPYLRKETFLPSYPSRLLSTAKACDSRKCIPAKQP